MSDRNRALRRFAPGLALVLVVPFVAGAGPGERERGSDAVARDLAAAIATALAEPEIAPTVLFEDVDVHATEPDRAVRVRVARGLRQPLREGFFVYANRLDVTLEDVRFNVTPQSHSRGTTRAPLAVIVSAVLDSLAHLASTPPPREYTIATLSDAVRDETLSRVRARPFSARLDHGDRGLTLESDVAEWSPAGDGLLLTRLVLTLDAGSRVAADEAYLNARGELIVTGPYRLTRGRAAHTGNAGVLVVGDAADRILRRGPIDLAAQISAAPVTMSGVLTPMPPTMFKRMFGDAGHRRSRM